MDSDYVIIAVWMGMFGLCEAVVFWSGREHATPEKLTLNAAGHEGQILLIKG